MKKEKLAQTLIVGTSILLVAIILAATLEAAPKKPLTIASGRGAYPVLGVTANDWGTPIPLGIARFDFLIKDKAHPKRGFGGLNYDILLDGDQLPIVNLVGNIENKSPLPSEPPLTMDFGGTAVIRGITDRGGDDTFTCSCDDADPDFMPDHFEVIMANGENIIFDPTIDLSVDGGMTIVISGGDFVFINNERVVIGVDPGDSYDIIDDGDPGYNIGDGQYSIIIDGGDTVRVGRRRYPMRGTKPIVVDGGDTIEVTIGTAGGNLKVAGTESLSVDGGNSWIVAERDLILLGANKGNLIEGDIFIRME